MKFREKVSELELEDGKVGSDPVWLQNLCSSLLHSIPCLLTSHAVRLSPRNLSCDSEAANYRSAEDRAETLNAVRHSYSALGMKKQQTRGMEDKLETQRDRS